MTSRRSGWAVFMAMVATVATLAMVTVGCGDPDAQSAPAADEPEATEPAPVSEPTASGNTTETSETTGPTEQPVPAPTDPTAPVTDVATCTPPPAQGSSPAPGDTVAVVAPWVDGHPDLFTGFWWDASAAQFLFTAVDVEQASALIEAELPEDLAYRVELVAHNASQLEALHARVSELSERGVDSFSYRRAWGGLLEIDLPVLDDASLDAVRQVFADDLDAVCVTGADPASDPPEGPQPTGGDGWRLLADQTDRGWPYTAHVAVNAAEYEMLWAVLALDGSPPSVDFATEVVVHFGAVYSSGCEEIRLDRVDIDRDRGVITADVVLLGGNRVCRADARPRAYLVAVERARLPTLPFTVSLYPSGCPACADAVVTDLDAASSPVIELSPYDRMQILAAAALDRVAVHNSFGGSGGSNRVEIIEVVGVADSDAFIDTEVGTPLNGDERDAITRALSPRTVRFVSVDDVDPSSLQRGTAVVTVADPAVFDGQLAVTTNLLCGFGCGTGGTFALDRLAHGAWTVTDPVGTQWIA